MYGFTNNINILVINVKYTAIASFNTQVHVLAYNHHTFSSAFAIKVFTISLYTYVNMYMYTFHVIKQSAKTI